MFKKVFLIIFLFLFLALVNPVKARAGARLYLEPASGTSAIGEEFSVSVKIDPANNDAVAVDAIINFDFSKLEVVEVEEETYFRDATVGTAQGFTYNIENSTGRISIYSFANVPNFSVSTPGTIATIKFKGKAAGTASVTFLCEAGNNGDSSIWDSEGNDLLDCAATGSGSYTIGEGDEPASTPTPVPTGSVAEPTATPTPSTLPETGVVSPLVLGVLFGGVFLGLGTLGLIF